MTLEELELVRELVRCVEWRTVHGESDNPGKRYREYEKRCEVLMDELVDRACPDHQWKRFHGIKKCAVCKTTRVDQRD